jgi:hypothetical protein
MKYLILYLLLGAIVAVWTAINNKTGPVDAPELPPRVRITSMLAAYVLVAVAWPVSLGLFAYALFIGLTRLKGPEQGR